MPSGGWAARKCRKGGKRRGKHPALCTWTNIPAPWGSTQLPAGSHCYSVLVGLLLLPAGVRATRFFFYSSLL